MGCVRRCPHRPGVSRLDGARVGAQVLAAWAPAGAAQCDLWFPPKKIPLEDGSKVLLPVMVITAAHSRFMVAKMIPTRHTEDLLLGMWLLLQQLGRVPRRLIWDNESGIGRGKRHAEGVGAFTGTLATTLVRLKPYDPESKGLVERRNWIAPGSVESGLCRDGGCQLGVLSVEQVFVLDGWDVAAV